MGLKVCIFIGVVVFWTLPRLVSAHPDPGLRSKSILEQIEEDDDNLWVSRMLIKRLEEDQNDLNLASSEFRPIENENQFEDQSKMSGAFEEETLTLTMAEVHQGPPIEHPIVMEFYKMDCASNTDCMILDSSGMECKDGKCLCMYYEGIPLKYQPMAKKCLGDRGHTCTHNYACHSRECVKNLKGKRWDLGDFPGVCNDAKSMESLSWYFKVLTLILALFWASVVVCFCIMGCCVKGTEDGTDRNVTRIELEQNGPQPEPEGNGTEPERNGTEPERNTTEPERTGTD